MCPPRVYFPVLCKFWQLYGGVNGDFLQEGLCHTLCDLGLLQQEPLPLRQATADLCLHRRYSNTPRLVWLSLCGVSASWCTQGFVRALRPSLAGMGFDYKRDFSPHTILLGLLLCPWIWGIFFWWDPTFSCQWLFSCESYFGVLAEDECTSFYSM